LAVFGFSAAFFLAMHYFILRDQCSEIAMIRREHAECTEVRATMPGGMWLLLVFTYALFIPNTWRRAAAVIASIAAMPILLVIVMMLVDPDVREVLGWKEATSFPLMMIVAAVTGLFGVDTIGSLRRQAYEARQLGQYRLKRRIGAGGMGEVFLAEHQLLKRPCVVKLIRPDKAGDEKVLMRFQREVRATAKLTHWNTVDIFDYGVTEDGTFYYVMEHLSGMSLGELVERFGPMPPERVIYLLGQACDALREAHAAGMIHRDIKPGNIFVARRGGVYDVAKLLDFGLVKPLLDQEEDSLALTAEGSITGSPLFMSPEQATGDTSPDARSDIYSLGAVGYYLLAGRPPFTGDRPVKVMIAHVRDEVVPPSEHNPAIPADLEQVILKCLAKQPEDRYPDVPSLGQALEACESAHGWNRVRAADWWQEQATKTAV
jgi:serine/threonine-protein kinase